MITTEAWVLHKGPSKAEPGELKREAFSFADISEHEVLAEPIYGCWEANMTHALQRNPIDVCRLRGEAKVVLGNAGVVRVLRTGAAVTRVREGALCVLIPIGSWDAAGYPLTILAYDAPATMGVLAKQMKLHETQLFPLPVSDMSEHSLQHSLQQWAAFSIRYGTAWDNWQVAYGAWRLQMMPRGRVEEENQHLPETYVWGWGGGVVLGELLLAKRVGCQVAMISSHAARLDLIKKMGITPIDRRQFMDLDFDERRFKADFAYRRRYMKAEIKFLDLVKTHTNGAGVSIFIDNIGGPVFRATLKALGRQGVITTSGWKEGMNLSVARGAECIQRHIHVHTHGSHRSDKGFYFALQNGWLPPVTGEVTSWDEIPQLAEAYAQGQIDSYFPIYQVNSL